MCYIDAAGGISIGNDVTILKGSRLAVYGNDNVNESSIIIFFLFIFFKNF